MDSMNVPDSVDTMLNVVHICDCVLKDAKDGDVVEFKGSGILMDNGTERFISIHQVDGQDVEEMQDDDEVKQNIEEELASEQGSSGDQPNLANDAEDALRAFMHTINK